MAGRLGMLRGALVVLLAVSQLTWASAVRTLPHGRGVPSVLDGVNLEVEASLNRTRAGGIEESYPLYKQCDPRWGSDLIVSKTVCKVGCLMSSISMGLAGWKISIDGQASNPGTLNAWLKENAGYTSSNNLIEDALNAIVPGIWSASGMHKTNDLMPSDLPQYMDDCIVVANVMNGRHFVLATGWDASAPDIVQVNDPGFDTSEYSFSSDIVGWRIFRMT